MPVASLVLLVPMVSRYSIALFSSLLRERGKEGLVSTVCTCTKLSAHFTVKCAVYVKQACASGNSECTASIDEVSIHTRGLFTKVIWNGYHNKGAESLSLVLQCSDFAM